MGFFDEEEKQARGADPSLKGLSVKVLHAKQCNVCPLNGQKLNSPHMEPSGTKQPDVYILGGNPGDDEDDADKQLAGESRRVLDLRLPFAWRKRIRWNNVVRTATPDNRMPTQVEIECCRPSVIADIERTKPRAIIGLGPIPLEWATGQTGITKWAGRRIPINVGKHKCWFFPMLHPEFVLKTRKFAPRDARTHGSDIEFKFALDFERAFAMIDNLPTPRIHTREDALEGVSYVTGHKEGDLHKVIKTLEACYDEDEVGVDYETDRKRPYDRDAKILSAALGMRDRSFAFAYQHKDAGWTPRQLATIKHAWRTFLIKAECKKVSHHLGFELEWSAVHFGVDTVYGPGWEDSMSQAYILDAATQGFIGMKKEGEQQRPLGTQGLDFLCLQHFGLPIKELYRMDRKHMADEKLENVLEYNAVDAKYHRALFIPQWEALGDEQLMPVYRHHLKRVRAAVLTQRQGVPIDPEQVEDFFQDHIRDLRKIEKQIGQMEVAEAFQRRYKHPFRPSSNQDIVLAMEQLEKVKLIPEKGKGGVGGAMKGKTNEDTLRKTKHPLAKAVIRWRKINKLLSTYILPVMPQKRLNEIAAAAKAAGHKLESTSVLFHDGKIHPVFPTTKTRTWRLSSEDPNAQNWPHRGPSKYVRKQVKVPNGYRIVAIDYAGIQARNVAMESGDKTLVKHYWDRYDIHSDWLSRLQRIVGNDWRPKEEIGTNLDAKKLHKELRSSVKNKFVFPSFFGAVGKTVAGYLGISERKGCALSEEFFHEFPEVKNFHETTLKNYRQDGYVESLSGFIRHAPIEINQLINAPIQADESIIVCDAWARLCDKRDERLVPVMMIHDDLTFIWQATDIDRLLEQTIPVMLKQVREWERIVPMEIEVSVGTNWCDMTPIGAFESTKNGDVRQVGKESLDRWDYKVGLDAVSETRQHDWED